MKGCVFDIQRCCLEDGPGIRTTVFLKGCNLRCIWCHNPESFLAVPQLSYDKNKCSGCRACEELCPQKVHRFENHVHTVDFQKCVMCGECVRACRQGALSQIGRWMESEEVAQIVARDRKYYEKSGGGVTISGGEPTMQTAFLLELLQACKSRGISTAIETNGIGEQRRFAAILPYVDLFLVDYKASDPLAHMRCTGQGHEDVYCLLELLTQAGKDTVLRCPVIPGINDCREHLGAIRELRRLFSCIRQIDIMPYHSAGAGKWEKIGLTYTLQDLKSMGREEADDIQKAVRS